MVCPPVLPLKCARRRRDRPRPTPSTASIARSRSSSRKPTRRCRRSGSPARVADARRETRAGRLHAPAATIIVMEQFALEFGPQRRIYKVSELNSAIRDLLWREFQDIWVSGEISGSKLAPSGHYYFTLKERDSQVKCVMYRSAHRYLKFKPQDGLAVLARGRLDIYEARGEYQLLVELLEPQGHGALQLAFEQLKKKLAADGLFEAGRKRPLPKYPRRIGLVTSPRGAAIQDILNILT